MSIHIHHAGQQSGPHSLAEIQARLRAGTLLPTDLAWYEGLPNWILVAQIPGAMPHGTGLPPKIEIPPFPSAPPLSPRTKAWLTGGGIGAFLLTLAVFITGVTLVCGRDEDLSLLGVLLFPVSVVLGIVSCHFFLALKHNPAGRCQVCSHAKPTIYGSLGRPFGAIILMFHRHISGHLCKDCVGKIFWEFTPLTCAVGWWGMISFFITPLVLVNNITFYIRSRFMKG